MIKKYLIYDLACKVHLYLPDQEISCQDIFQRTARKKSEKETEEFINTVTVKITPSRENGSKNKIDLNEKSSFKLFSYSLLLYLSVFLL